MLGRLVPLSLLAAALLAGCSTPTAPPDASDAAPKAAATPASPASRAPAPSAASPTPAADLPPTITVLDVAPLPEEWGTSIAALAFSAPELRAPVGSTITWRNLDVVAHTVSSDDGTFSGSGPIAPGMSFSRTFLSAGEYAYHCAIHPDMKGRVVVG